MWAVALLGLCRGAIACNGSDRALETSLRARIGADGTAFCMSEVATFDWDTLFLFQPYTPAKQMEEALGFAWADASRVDLSNDEGSVILVFVKDRRVVRHLKLRRSGADLAQRHNPKGLRVSRSAAAFIVTRERGWTYVDLVAEDQREGLRCPT